MFRPTPLKLILGVLLVAATYFVSINSHMDLFPCELTRLDYQTDRLETQSSSCSLMQTQGDYMQPPERAELTGAGYAVAVLVVGVGPMLLGFVLGSIFRRRRE
jgi:hypothetical protein